MRSGGNVLDAALAGTHNDLLDEFHTYSDGQSSSSSIRSR